MQDPRLTTEESGMEVHDPNTQQVVPEGTASLVDGITLQKLQAKDIGTPRLFLQMLFS